MKLGKYHAFDITDSRHPKWLCTVYIKESNLESFGKVLKQLVARFKTKNISLSPNMRLCLSTGLNINYSITDTVDPYHLAQRYYKAGK